MKLAIVSDHAKWVLDDIAKDYRKYSSVTIVPLTSNPDLIWAVNYWDVSKLIREYRNVVVQLHHVSQDKIEKYDFEAINKCLACIVPNDITYDFIHNKISVKTVKLPYWILSDRMKESNGRQISGERIFVGSFQKDSNGNTDMPKLEKGPDVFVEVVKRLREQIRLTVILSGYSRKYVIKELDKHNIAYKYFERDLDINGLYDVLDWYLVTSRSEGGPQAVLEASYRKIKILSTRVGMAPEILHSSCICDNVDEFVNKIIDLEDHREYNYQSVQRFAPEKIIPIWDKFFMDLTS